MLKTAILNIYSCSRWHQTRRVCSYLTVACCMCTSADIHIQILVQCKESCFNKQNVKTGGKILWKWSDRSERCTMFRMPNDIKTADNMERLKHTIRNNRHITVTEVASNLPSASDWFSWLSIMTLNSRKSLYTVCVMKNFVKHVTSNVKKPTWNIRTNTDTTILTTEQKTLNNSYTSKTEGILGRIICQ